MKYIVAVGRREGYPGEPFPQTGQPKSWVQVTSAGPRPIPALRRSLTDPCCGVAPCPQQADVPFLDRSFPRCPVSVLAPCPPWPRPVTLMEREPEVCASFWKQPGFVSSFALSLLLSPCEVASGLMEGERPKGLCAGRFQARSHPAALREEAGSLAYTPAVPFPDVPASSRARQAHCPEHTPPPCSLPALNRQTAERRSLKSQVLFSSVKTHLRAFFLPFRSRVTRVGELVCGQVTPPAPAFLPSVFFLMVTPICA